MGGINYPAGVLAILVLVASLASCSGPREDAAAPEQVSLIQLRLSRAEPAPDREPFEFEGDTLYLESKPVLSDGDFERVQAHVGSGQLHIDFELTPQAAERFISTTSEEVGTPLAIFVDSQLRSAPVIRDRLGPRGRITISASDEEVDRLLGLVRSRWQETPQ